MELHALVSHLCGRVFEQRNRYICHPNRLTEIGKFYGQLWLFVDKIKTARKPGKKQKENPEGCTGEI